MYFRSDTDRPCLVAYNPSCASLSARAMVFFRVVDNVFISFCAIGRLIVSRVVDSVFISLFSGDGRISCCPQCLHLFLYPWGIGCISVSVLLGQQQPAYSYLSHYRPAGFVPHKHTGFATVLLICRLVLPAQNSIRCALRAAHEKHVTTKLHGANHTMSWAPAECVNTDTPRVLIPQRKARFYERNGANHVVGSC